MDGNKNLIIVPERAKERHSILEWGWILSEFSDYDLRIFLPNKFNGGHILKSLIGTS